MKINNKYSIGLLSESIKEYDDYALYRFFYVTSEGISLKTTVLNILLTFLGRSGSNHSAFYLYRATSVGCSSNPSLYACISIEWLWLMYAIVRTLH